jgi:hypothetical protein
VVTHFLYLRRFFQLNKGGVFRVIIGDDFLTKILLTNTLSRNEKLRSQTSQTNEFSTLFTNVLNQLLKEQQIPPLTGEKNMNLFPQNLELGNIMGVPNNVDITNTNLDTMGSFGASSINSDKIDSVLEGKLAGKGMTFIAAGQKYNVDPALLVAIAQHETGNGNSRAAIEKNNIAGMMGKNGLKSYQSVEESIMDMARNLSENYLGKGFTTIAKIGAKYAPLGAENDPLGLNNHWINGVTKYYNKLTIA